MVATRNKATIELEPTFYRAFYGDLAELPAEGLAVHWNQPSAGPRDRCSIALRRSSRSRRDWDFRLS
jgi:hypothetical protein